MRLLFLEYKPTFLKMVISGIFGVWLHVLIDAFYHWDVLIFWPSRVRPLYGLISRGQVKLMCLAFFVPAIIVYVFAAVLFVKKNKTKKADSE